jgi:predicted peptidase
VTNSAPEIEGVFEAQLFRDGQGRTIPYRRLSPPKIEPGQHYPLVLLFHGAGERGTDNRLQLRLMLPAFLREENRTNHPCFVLAPQCPPGKRWVEVPWGDAAHTMPAEPSESMALALGMLDEALANLPVDRDRVYVCGASMGGFGTWDALSRCPERFAAALPVCGGADLQQAVRIAHIPVWVFHGDQDTVVLPSRSIAMIEAMRRAGGDPKLTLYPGGDHDAWTATFNNPEVLAWLFAQHRAAIVAPPQEIQPSAESTAHTQKENASSVGKPAPTNMP